MDHTCIKDDGGTPNWWCHACAAETEARVIDPRIAVITATLQKYVTSMPLARSVAIEVVDALDAFEGRA